MRVPLLALTAIASAACIPDTPAPAPAAKPAASAAPAANAGTIPEITPEIANDPKKLLETVDALREQLKGKPRDFQVNVALGNLFYDNGRYVEAIEYFTDGLALTKDVEPLMLAAKADPKPVGATPAECGFDAVNPAARGNKPFEQVLATVAAFDKTNPDGARACRVSLAPVVAGLHARRGNSWYLVGNPEKAKEDHAAALALDGNHPEALFFLGALTFELARGDAAELEKGRGYWQKLLEVAPDHARAELVKQTLPRVHELFGARPNPMAGHPPVAGNDAPPQGPAPLAPGVAEAMAKVERTPELEANLDKLLADGDKLLTEGKWQQALDTFKQVMPLRPDGRVALGMGVALRELGKPMAERIIQQAAVMPGGDKPRARFELAKLYEKTDTAQARTIYGELATDATWGPRAKERLAALK